MRIFSCCEQMIGETPILRAERFGREVGVVGELLVKLEGFNPFGSAKDRAVCFMLGAAEREGRLRRGETVIEATSGNTGIALSALSAVRGYRAIIVMPSNASRERIALMKAYGAEVVLTDARKGVAGAQRVAESLARERGGFLLGQFENPTNPLSHYETTAQEIWRDTDGRVEIFVAGAGTGGVISGVGRFLREKKPGVRVVAVEPRESSVLLGGSKGTHSIEGIGAGFLPKNLDLSVIDEVVAVSADEARKCARLFAQTEGLLVGISSGAVLAASAVLMQREENLGRTLLCLLADSGERYLSTNLFL